MTTVSSPVKIRTESNSTVAIDEEVADDEPDLVDVVKLAGYRILLWILWPYVLAWEIFTSTVYVCFAPLKIVKLFAYAIISTLQIFAQTTQSIADGSAFEKNRLPDVNLVVTYANLKQSGAFNKTKEYLANSETLKRWVNEIHQWASKVDSKPPTITNGEAKKDTTPDEVDLND